MKAKGTFTVASWDEKDLGGAWEGKRVMKVEALFELCGDMEGQLLAAYLMHYSESDSGDPHDRTATYTGFLRFEGSILGKAGTALFQDGGKYADSVPHSEFAVVKGSGTGELADLSGSGRYYAQGGEMRIEVEAAGI